MKVYMVYFRVGNGQGGSEKMVMGVVYVQEVVFGGGLNLGNLR